MSSNDPTTRAASELLSALLSTDYFLPDISPTTNAAADPSNPPKFDFLDDYTSDHLATALSLSRSAALLSQLASPPLHPTPPPTHPSCSRDAYRDPDDFRRAAEALGKLTLSNSLSNIQDLFPKSFSDPQISKWQEIELLTQALETLNITGCLRSPDPDQSYLGPDVVQRPSEFSSTPIRQVGSSNSVNSHLPTQNHSSPYASPNAWGMHSLTPNNSQPLFNSPYEPRLPPSPFGLFPEAPFVDGGGFASQDFTYNVSGMHPSSNMHSPAPSNGMHTARQSAPNESTPRTSNRDGMHTGQYVDGRERRGLGNKKLSARNISSMSSDIPLAPLAENASPSLVGFRNGTLQIRSLRDIEADLLEFCQDQYGSRFIQQQLGSCSPDELRIAMAVCIPNVRTLTVDVFGNYVMQKCFELGTSDQQRLLLNGLTGQFLELSLHVYGCRVLQKVFESVRSESQRRIMLELSSHIIKCVEDQNGNHVIQKCIEHVADVKQLDFIISAFNGQVARMASHCYGCRVIQRIMERCPVSQTETLIDEVMRDLVALSQDQYGNYVVQHVVQFGRYPDQCAIVDLVCSRMVEMSTHKFASNVVEKSIQNAPTPEMRDRIIRSIVDPMAQELSPVMSMIRDRYANYVVQRAIELATGELRICLLNLLKGQMTTIRRITYGKHIVSALERSSNREGNI